MIDGHAGMGYWISAAHRKAFPCASSRAECPTGRAVEHGIAQDKILLGRVARGLRWTDDDFAAAHPLGDVIIRLSDKGQA